MLSMQTAGIRPEDTTDDTEANWKTRSQYSTVTSYYNQRFEVIKRVDYLWILVDKLRNRERHGPFASPEDAISTAVGLEG
jgi:hypothetical protein